MVASVHTEVPRKQHTRLEQISLKLDAACETSDCMRDVTSKLGSVSCLCDSFQNLGGGFWPVHGKQRRVEPQLLQDGAKEASSSISAACCPLSRMGRAAATFEKLKFDYCCKPAP